MNVADRQPLAKECNQLGCEGLIHSVEGDVGIGLGERFGDEAVTASNIDDQVARR